MARVRDPLKESISYVSHLVTKLRPGCCMPNADPFRRLLPFGTSAAAMSEVRIARFAEPDPHTVASDALTDILSAKGRCLCPNLANRGGAGVRGSPLNRHSPTANDRDPGRQNGASSVGRCGAGSTPRVVLLLPLPAIGTSICWTKIVTLRVGVAWQVLFSCPRVLPRAEEISAGLDRG